MTTIQVNTTKPYEIIISNELNFGKIAKPFIQADAILFHDSNIPRNMVHNVEQSLQENGIKISTISLTRQGEDIKTFTYAQEIFSMLMHKAVNRKTTFIALGGGTVGDFIGFVASTFMRGVKFIQIPTTLLSMVDSSVGGKVAINLESYKNCVGAFYQPEVVLIDTSFLASLPSMELISGYAEIIKYGFIHDASFLEYLLQKSDIFASLVKNKLYNHQAMEYLTFVVGRSCEIKADFVCRDENETQGVREMLNFGHTFAHAFEGLYLGKMPHGIAVGIGMIYACKFCKILIEDIIIHYQKIGLYSSITQFCNEYSLALPKTEDIVSLMRKDKKNTNSHIKLILLEQVGSTTIKEVKEGELIAFVSSVLDQEK